MYNLNNIIRDNIKKLEPYSSARDEFNGSEGLFLDANENPFGTLNRYPDPYQQELKSKIASLKDLNSSDIFIGNGSDEIIDLAFRIFCEPGIDKALTFSPTYGMYDVSAGINNIDLIKLPLNEQFQIDLKSFEKYLKDDNLKLIFICSPNNPTGNVLDENDIEYILRNFKGVVIIDEAYIDFSPTRSWTKRLWEFPNLIVTQTFSKAWGLASARVGIAYTNKVIVQWFNRVKPPYNVSQLNQEAALDVLLDPERFEKYKRIILDEKIKLKTKLEKLDFVKRVFPSDANFYLLEVESANDIYNTLTNQKIIVRNRNKIIKNCIRITVGSPEENEKLIQSLKNIENEKSTIYR